MESIRIWLNGNRNYAAGVKLYLQFGTDEALKRMFRMEEQTDFKTKKLLSALTAMLADKKADVVKTIIIQDKQVERIQAERIMGKGWSEKPDEIESALYNRWKPMFLEMMDLISRIDEKARMGVYSPVVKAEAGRMALRILDLDDACDEIYEQRDQYLVSGKRPQEKGYEELCIDPKLVPKKLQNHQRYARDYRNKLKKNPADVDAAEQLKKHEWFIEQYKKFLNEL